MCILLSVINLTADLKTDSIERKMSMESWITHKTNIENIARLTNSEGELIRNLEYWIHPTWTEVMYKYIATNFLEECHHEIYRSSQKIKSMFHVFTSLAAFVWGSRRARNFLSPKVYMEETVRTVTPRTSLRSVFCQQAVSGGSSEFFQVPGPIWRERNRSFSKSQSLYGGDN